MHKPAIRSTRVFWSSKKAIAPTFTKFSGIVGSGLWNFEEIWQTGVVKERGKGTYLTLHISLIRGDRDRKIFLTDGELRGL